MTKKEFTEILTGKDSFVIQGISIHGMRDSIKKFTHNEIIEDALHFHIKHKRYIKYEIVEDYEFGAKENNVDVSLFSMSGNYITTYKVDLEKEDGLE